jgi:hypothetical protein
MRFQIMAVLAAGALIGYAAATAEVLAPTPAQELLDTSDERVSGTNGSDVGAKLHLVAQARAESTQANAQKSGKAAGGAANKPNILVIMGDDIGWFNPSCYHKE